MGLRFRRRVKIMPGLRLNLSRRGGSLSVGGPGATLNLGRGKRMTVGIPGTGISYSRTLAPGDRGSRGARTIMVWVVVAIAAILAGLYVLGRIAG